MIFMLQYPSALNTTHGHSNTLLRRAAANYSSQNPQEALLDSRLSEALLEFSLSYLGRYSDQPKITGGSTIRRSLEGIQDTYISLSHCKGLVACALGASETGIDAEYIRPFSKLVAQRVCSEDEMESIRLSEDQNAMFFRLWTLKESYGKALGVGLGYPLRQTSFIIEGGLVKSNIADYDFTICEEIEGYIVSLCRKIVVY